MGKEKETKLQKEQEKIQQRQENDESQEETSNSKTANKSKSIIDTMIDKVRKLSTDEKEPALSENNINSMSINENEKNEDKIIKEKEQKKLAKEEEIKNKKLAKKESI